MNSDSDRRDHRDDHASCRTSVQKLVVSKSLVKFSKLAFRGMIVDELRVPSGLNAAETTNRIGKSAKSQRDDADQMCRQPTCRNQLPLALPSRTTCGGPSSAVRGVFQLGGGDGCFAHQLISSRTLVRRKPTIEMTATIRKIRIEIAAAKP